jgi:hypothetical protein
MQRRGDRPKAVRAFRLHLTHNGQYGGPVAAEPKLHFRLKLLQMGLDLEDAAAPEARNGPNGAEKVSHANVLLELPQRGYGHLWWIAACLLTSESVSCGCTAASLMRPSVRRHGERPSPDTRSDWDRVHDSSGPNSCRRLQSSVLVLANGADFCSD